VRGGRSFFVLLGVAAALGAYIYFVELERDPAGSAEKRDRVFALEGAKLEELEVRAASGEVTTLKKDGEVWRIASPAGLDADDTAVGSLVSTVESLEIQRTLEENPASVAPFGLEPPRLTVAIRAAGDTALRRLHLGRKTPTGGDVYARVEGQPRLFLISAYLEESLNKTPFDLRDKAALKVDRIGVDVMALESSGSPTLAFGRKGSEWRLTRPLDARADFSLVDNVIGRLAQARMKSIEPTPAGVKELSVAELKTYGLDKPQATATLGVGSTRATLAIGTKRDETSVYARDVSRPLVFTLDASLLDDFKLKPADLRKKDLFDFRSFTAIGLDLAHGKTTATFAKEKEQPKEETGKDKPDEAAPPVEKWKLTRPAAKDVDQSKMTDLLTTLSNLRADTFADRAHAGGEELIVTARFGDAASPRSEKVTFRKSGDTVHAILPGEPGAAVVSASEFDKALALFKELAGTK